MELNLPLIKLNLKNEDGICKVFDPLRGKYVALTPEEYVRQHFTAWLISDFHYPPSLMANEISINLNGLTRRCDTVIFYPDGSPLLIVEYKAPDIKITQNTFDQIVRYNMTLRAKYLIVSNGINHYCCVINYEKDNYYFIPSIPDYDTLRRPICDN